MLNNVEFETDKVEYDTRPRTSSGYVAPGTGGINGNEPRMVRWLMRKGIAKSPLMGQVILIGLIVVNLIITYIVIKYLL
jgi:hypothetical protein